jgi:hypothetical protein
MEIKTPTTREEAVQLAQLIVSKLDLILKILEEAFPSESYPDQAQ